MRALILFFVVLAAGMFFGHEFWPKAHSDPAFHFRFHRGKIPYVAQENGGEPKEKAVKKHGRVFPSAKPVEKAEPTPVPRS